VSNSINVTSIGSLEELERSIGHLSSEVRDGIEAAERQIKRKKEILDEIAEDRRRSVAGWQSAYDSADDEDDDVGLIQRKLEEAEENFREARQWQGRMAELCAGYERCLAQTSYLANEQSDKARVFLRQRITELYEYLETKPDVSAVNLASSGSSTLAITEAVLIASEKTIDSVVRSSEVLASAMTALPLPKGFEWVTLRELKPDEMDELPSEKDYRKNGLSESDMRHGLELLKNRILPEIERNPETASKEYFAELDAAEGRSGSDSLAEIFSAYFGRNHHIWVDRFKGDQFFGIGNGRHRIKAARDLGWTAIPARISEVDPTEKPHRT